jgi:hypothetical protein
MQRNLLNTEPRELEAINPRDSGYAFRQTDTGKEVAVRLSGDVTHSGKDYDEGVAKKVAWQVAFDALELGLPTGSLTLDKKTYDRFRLTGSLR